MADIFQHPDFKRYKFKELRVYSSTEWLADNKKKYRQVFDRQETSYIYAELSFYNKFFDHEDWDVSVELVCYSLRKGKKELCRLTVPKKVSKYDNVVFIREGWGNKAEGIFWKRGAYFWEAYIEGEKVGAKYFYIEEPEDEPLPDENAYLAIDSLKLYEGPYDDVNKDDRAYYRKFHSEETRYIYVEMAFRNLNPGRSWHCELFTKFYNDARELKGQVVRLQRVEKDWDTIHLTAGWGSNVEGSWRKDRYTAEIVFMDKLLAVVPFEVADDFEPGDPAPWMPHSDGAFALAPQTTSIDVKSFEEVMGELDALIGLQEIKKQVRKHANYLQFLQLRKDKGFSDTETINVHAVFIGNPGTGKTTVAGMMGRLYFSMGLLSRGHVHEVDRVDLVGEYIGQTAPKVREAIDKARGGVLFIDEAYSLARSNDDTKDFGREVIEILVKEMSNGPGDLAVIVAGYPKEMQHFLNSNPGLRSRFKHVYQFSDYLPQELSLIADLVTDRMNVTLSLEAKALLDDMIVEAYRNRDRSFGNARFVTDLIEKAKINLGLRIMARENPRASDRDDLARLLAEDIEALRIDNKPTLPAIPVDESLLAEAMRELHGLISIHRVKAQIEEMVRLVRYYRESNRDVLNAFFLHTVLIGNPGTGKTTVARILAKIYKALGILERGHLVETDRQGLVAGHIGGTALKTAERVDESLGGVLFIDEAYALTQRQQGGTDEYGAEAIQTLLKRMEDKRGKFFVFVAGYPENMEAFLKANPGLSSRFDKILRFDDYTPDELYTIAVDILQAENLSPNEEAAQYLRSHFQYLFDTRDKYFGNARTVRSLMLDLVKKFYLRRAGMSPEEREQAGENTLLLADVLSLGAESESIQVKRPSIGFRREQ